MRNPLILGISGIALLIAGAALGFLVQGQMRWGEVAGAPANGRTPLASAPDISEWKYPGAEKGVENTGASLRDASGEKLLKLTGHAAVWTTPEDFDKVVAFYTNKLEVETDDPAAKSDGMYSWTSAPTVNTPMAKALIPDTTPAGTKALSARPVRVQCLFRRTTSYAVTVFVSRADSEDHTHIVVAYDIR
jgi:hypothetical protein